MSSAFTDHQARVARIFGPIGVLVSFCLFIFALWSGADDALPVLVYISPLLLLATCATFYVAGKQRSRKYESLAFGLFGGTILLIGAQGLLAWTNGEEVNVVNFVMWGILPIPIAIGVITVAVVIYLRKDDSKTSG
jgi:predicted membrane channel-forming protein YqfA (hemolysin III family)